MSAAYQMNWQGFFAHKVAQVGSGLNDNLTEYTVINKARSSEIFLDSFEFVEPKKLDRIFCDLNTPSHMLDLWYNQHLFVEREAAACLEEGDIGEV